MNLVRNSFSLLFFVLAFTFITPVHAQEAVSQFIKLEPGWNIVSTPKVLESHSFSADETSENFDIYLLDASQPTGWATMADLGQTEFTPLFGYFIKNKTGTEQTLTFNYDTSVEPNDKLFERTFDSVGWYSIGVANDEYAKSQNADTSDADNPSRILSLLEGDYDLVIDFTDANYGAKRSSVALTDPWKASAPVDIDELNDLRETKGYAIYIKNQGAKYIGFQNDATSTEQEGGATLALKPENRVVALDQWFDMSLTANSENINVNGVTATVNFDPSALQVVEIRRDQSDLNLWSIEPTFSNAEGTIEFGGGSPTPLNGEFNVIDITFEATQEGTTTISYSDAQILASDGLGTNIYETSGPDSIFIGPSNIGDNDELNVTTSTNDPDSTILVLNDDADSDWYTTFVWNLDASDSPNNIAVESIEVDVELSTSTYWTIVDDARLVVNGVTYNDLVVTNGDSNLATLWFDTNGLLSVGAGEIKEAELQLRFNALSVENEDMTISASTWAQDYDASGIDDLSPSQLAGSAISDTHILMTQGIYVPANGVNNETNTYGDNDQVGEFVIEFEVTAIENDFFISENGVNFRVDGGTATTSSSLTATADEALSGVFAIQEGETETFTLVVQIEPQTTGQFRLVLESIEFSDVATIEANDRIKYLLPESDYRTSYQAVNGSQ